jgi:hypothetical protein
MATAAEPTPTSRRFWYAKVFMISRSLLVTDCSCPCQLLHQGCDADIIQLDVESLIDAQ